VKSSENQRTSRVAWLKTESVEEEMEVDDVALSTVRASLGGGRPSVGADEGSIDVGEHISPHFANPCVKGLNLSDQQREVEGSTA